MLFDPAILMPEINSIDTLYCSLLHCLKWKKQAFSFYFTLFFFHICTHTHTDRHRHKHTHILT